LKIELVVSKIKQHESGLPYVIMYFEDNDSEIYFRNAIVISLKKYQESKLTVGDKVSVEYKIMEDFGI